MIVRKILVVTVITTLFFISSAIASEININATSYGSAKDNTADGVFDSLTSSITAHAQVTNFLNIFTVTRGMLEFEISSLALPIDDATLDFYITGYSGPNTTVSLLGYEGNGVVELPDAYLGSAMIASFDVTSTGTFSINVTNYINNSIINDIQFIGFNLRIASEYMSSSSGYDNEINIISFNSGPFQAPVLSITTAPSATPVPVPLTAWIICSFFLGLIGVISLKPKKGN